MEERTGIITFQSNPLVLCGPELKIGTTAPDFTLVDPNLKKLTRESLSGKKIVVVTVPSLDTPVCDIEAKRFNAEAAKLGSDVVVLVVSMDLPFAQKRWCGAADAGQIKVASDHSSASFGERYGVLIKELRLLARAVFVIDTKGIVQYIQVVPEITNEPDYNAVLAALKMVS